jgi:hypothetical protein
MTDWLIPATSHRLFPSQSEEVLLLHNSGKGDVWLHESEVRWLISKYRFHNCLPLDVEDVRQDDPRLVDVTPPDRGDLNTRLAACEHATRFTELCKSKNVKSSYSGWVDVPLPVFRRF